MPLHTRYILSIYLHTSPLEDLGNNIHLFCVIVENFATGVLCIAKKTLDASILKIEECVYPPLTDIYCQSDSLGQYLIFKKSKWQDNSENDL